MEWACEARGLGLLIVDTEIAATSAIKEGEDALRKAQPKPTARRPIQGGDRR